MYVETDGVRWFFFWFFLCWDCQGISCCAFLLWGGYMYVEMGVVFLFVIVWNTEGNFFFGFVFALLILTGCVPLSSCLLLLYLEMVRVFSYVCLCVQGVRWATYLQSESKPDPLHHGLCSP